MSNHRAIAACTAALRYVLTDAATRAVDGASVTFLRPDAPSGLATAGSRVNLFLYQVTPNAAWRNADLPTRGTEGIVRQPPQAALDLHYLVTFFGDDAELVPQRLLGSTVSALHAHPVLNRQQIKSATDGFPGELLAKSDLHEQVELIKFSPSSLNLEELSRLWMMFVQVPYALSVTYQASVVLIAPDISFQTALPVRTRNLYVDPFRRPVLDQVIAEGGADQPILPGDRLIAHGRGLRGDSTKVRINGLELDPDFVSETELRLQVPTASVRAGILGVQVVQPRLLGIPPSPHGGIESNVVPIIVRPALKTDAQDGKLAATFDVQDKKLTVPVTPSVGLRQRAVLFLSPLADTSSAYSLPALPRKSETDPVFDLEKTAPGKYLVRLQVDGAESLVEIENNQPARPWIEIPPEVPQ